jgi:hypothetical protein
LHQPDELVYLFQCMPVPIEKPKQMHCWAKARWDNVAVSLDAPESSVSSPGGAKAQLFPECFWQRESASPGRVKAHRRELSAQVNPEENAGHCLRVSASP